MIQTQNSDKFAEEIASAPVEPTTPSEPAAPAPSDTMNASGMTTVWMKADSHMLKINDKTTQMDTTPFIWSGKTYIPLRYLGEGIGAQVKWDAKTQMVWVKAGNDTLKFWVGKNIVRRERNTEKGGHEPMASYVSKDCPSGGGLFAHGSFKIVRNS
ncbi:copper amine oxidase N-terminal domain-containing protein [Paenibacillus terrae]|uniref:copper amine oxidase N-terminal domain-containing protein n=1 Tax=Paenibacillus terrae TaxID=159743 RepID=UPI0021CC53D1|nr:copper amine oxidase N-terminal domain-containing protein [Paenibacillus terrae]